MEEKKRQKEEISELKYQWYALYTHSRAEKKVFEQLVKSGIEAYLPLQKILKQWSDRKKWVEEPLLRSYVFVNVSEREYYEVLNTKGVSRYVTFGGKAAPIPEKQINAMKIAVGSNLPMDVCSQSFLKGQQVKISVGPLKGIEGEVIAKCGKHKLLIRIDHIGYVLSVEVSSLLLEPALY